MQPPTGSQPSSPRGTFLLILNQHCTSSAASSSSKSDFEMTRGYDKSLTTTATQQPQSQPWMFATVIEDDDLTFGGKPLCDWYEEGRRSIEEDRRSAEEEQRRGRPRVRSHRHHHHSTHHNTAQDTRQAQEGKQ